MQNHHSSHIRRLGFCLALVVLAWVALPAGQEKSTLDEELRQFQALASAYGDGLKKFDEGDLGGAAAFERCVQMMPGHAFAHYYLANILYIRKDFPGALAHRGFPSHGKTSRVAAERANNPYFIR